MLEYVNEIELRQLIDRGKAAGFVSVEDIRRIVGGEVDNAVLDDVLAVLAADRKSTRLNPVTSRSRMPSSA